jgi:hypothetical protein
MVVASPAEASCASPGRLNDQICILALGKPLRGRHPREESLRGDEPRRDRPGIHACPPLEDLEDLGQRLEGSARVAELERRKDHTASLLRKPQQATPSPKIAHRLSSLYTDELLDVPRFKKWSEMPRPYCFCRCDQGSTPPELGGIPDFRRDLSEP